MPEHEVDPRDAEIASLRARVEELLKEVAALKAELARARKDSSNSSKPPSSDIVKPPASSRSPGKRPPGGQPGHPRHERAAVPPDRVDRVILCTLRDCPKGHGMLLPARRPPRVLQQVGLVDKPFVVTEWRAVFYWCPGCQEYHCGELPPEVERAGFFDSRAIALVAWLKSRSHGSYSIVQEFLADIGNLHVSRGFLAKVVQKASAALAEPYAELEAAVRHEDQLNVDETSHPENKQLLWTWVFRARLFTLFRIDPSRGSEVLLEVLGAEFEGVLGCDYFSAYRKFMGDCNVLVQFCLAHLIRDVKFLLSLSDPVTRNYGTRLLEALRQLFRVIHRREEIAEGRFQRKLERAGENVVRVGRRAPPRREAQNLAQRFRDHGDAYLRFITTPGIPPTNNLAEQAIRFVVIDRRVTQGTRSEKGRRWSERIWTATATCVQQGRSLFAYLCDAIRAHFADRPVPSLLPSGP